MKKLLLMGLLALGGCSSQHPNRQFVPLKANPSAIIAAELAFNRLAQEKGQWTAFRETSTKDAEMFVPGRVVAADWLKGRANPPQSVTWQPHKVWSSCDGTAGATHGAWQRPDGSHGYFTTVWQRQKDGNYKWVMDSGEPTNEAISPPEMISAIVAKCTGTIALPISAPAEGANMKVGMSRDQTFSWVSIVNQDLSREITLRTWDGSNMIDVQTDIVSAPKAS